jgi:hypothetical protein
MAFSFKNSKGKTYFLHAKKVQRAGGKVTTLFYFAGDARPAEVLDSVPAGYEVVEMKTGMPVLKKK